MRITTLGTIITLFCWAAAERTEGGSSKCCESPLVLDLEANGIATTDIWYPVEFDIDGDGILEYVSWTRWDAQDAFLCLDVNGNGCIDSGHELFGNYSLTPDGMEHPNGFDSLAVYDQPAYGGNNDRRISSGDYVWDDLRLWLDLNHNGISEPSELHCLNRFGLVWIGLVYVTLDEPVVDGNTNIFRHFSLFQRRVQGGRWLISMVWDMYPRVIDR
ncbi:MAG: hypothetical protein AB1714_05925 [Acidobacteriota bacterium]